MVRIVVGIDDSPAAADALRWVPLRLTGSAFLLARWSQRSKQQSAQGARKKRGEHEPELREMVLQRQKQPIVFEPLLRLGYGPLSGCLL